MEIRFMIGFIITIYLVTQLTVKTHNVRFKNYRVLIVLAE